MRLTPNKELQDLVNTKIGTPVNAVASQGTLELTGDVLDGETFTVGSETFEIDTDSTVTAGNIAIDVSTFATASQGTLDITGVVPDGDTFVVGGDTFEIDTDSTVTPGNLPIDLSAFATASQGTLDITGVVKDGETIFVGGTTVFEFDTDGNIIGGNIPIDISTYCIASQGTLIVDTQPIVGDTFTIGVGGGSKTYTFVAEVDADTDGEIGIGADLAGAQGNIVAAINGTDGFNTAHTQVTAGTFALDNLIITAIVPGTPGDLIATTETFFAATNIFDAATLGTTTAGADCPAADADGLVISTINGEGIDITASQGAGTTVIFTHNTPGTIGNAYGVTVTMVNGTFDGITLGTTTAGADCTAANADGKIITDYMAQTTENITATQGAGTTVIFTHNTPGTIGNATVFTENLTNATVDGGGVLGGTTAGSDCSAADADGQIISDFNAGSTVLVTASQGAGTTIIFTADVKGVAGDLIPTTDTLSHGSFDDVTLGTTTAGVDGTVAQAGDIWVDATHIYIPTADNTIVDANWRKIAHIAL